MTDTMKNLLLSMSAAAFFALAVLSIPAHSADLKGPATRVDAAGNEKPLFSGCYGGVGGAGFVFEGNEAIKSFAAGAGCDFQRGRLVFGLGANYLIGRDDFKALDTYGRIGLALNPHMQVFARGGLLFDANDFDLGNAVVTLGGGVEFFIAKNVTVTLEAATNVKEWGDMRGMPDTYMLMGKLNYRFPSLF